MITSNLKCLMEKSGFSIPVLASTANVSAYTIIRARSSKTIRFCKLDTLERIAKVLNCSPKQLYEYEKD